MAYQDGGPTNNWVSTTPHDTNYVKGEFSAFDFIRVDTAGPVVVTQLGGTDITFTLALAGEYIPVQGVRIKNTGTTATTVQCAFPPRPVAGN